MVKTNVILGYYTHFCEHIFIRSMSYLCRRFDNMDAHFNLAVYLTFYANLYSGKISV